MKETNHMPDNAKALLLALLGKPSVNGEDNESAIAMYICEYLKANGIDAICEWAAPGRANVIAVIEGRDTSQTVIWNGHLDTVPYGDLNVWLSPPDQPLVLADRVVARGSSDMKSGLAVMIYTLVQMHQKGIQPAYNLLFLATCDEERGGIGAMHFCEQHGMDNVQHLLIAEPTGCQLGIAQKGCLWLDLSIQGSTSHGAYPEKGVNALDIGIAIHQHLKQAFEADQHALLGHSTVTLTKLNGGIAANMVPDQCEMSLDIRLTPAYQSAQVCATLEAFINHEIKVLYPDASVFWQIVNDRMAIGLAETHALYHQYQAIQAKVSKLDVNAENNTANAKAENAAKENNNHKWMAPVGVRYFTDASVLIKSNPEIPVLLYGPGRAALAHQPNEALYWSDFERALAFYEAVYQMTLQF
jgi:succinyl-diaminopimelate desuccinylase